MAADFPLVVPGDELFLAWVLPDPIQERTLEFELSLCPIAPRYPLLLSLISAPSLLELQVPELQVSEWEKSGGQESGGQESGWQEVQEEKEKLKVGKLTLVVEIAV